MTQQAQTHRATGPGQLAIDLGPIAVFVLAFNILQRFPETKDNAVYYATGLFIASTLAAMAYCQWKLGRIPPVLFVTGALVTAFGGLTIALHNDYFIKIKPTVINLFYASAIVVSLLMKQNVWKLLFGHLFVLPERIWTVLALRWAGFFVFLAIVNEVIWRTQSFGFWVNAKLLVMTPLVFLFGLLNTPLVLKHQIEEPSQTEAPGADAG